MSRGLLRLGVALLAVGVLVALDLRTKRWATNELRPRGTRTLAGGHLVLQYRENTGIAFGLLRDGGEARQPALVAYGAVVALALAGLLVRRLARRGDAGFLISAGLAALLAGTLGNLHDRLERGYVIDFVAAGRGAVRWPTFNLADVALAVGLALCLLGLIVTAARRTRVARAALG